MRMVLTILALVLSMAARAIATEPVVVEWTPDRTLVEAIDARVVMPPGAEPIDAYVRYYVGLEVDGARKVGGTFILRSWLGEDAPEGDVLIVTGRELPIMFDLGCARVYVYYDVQSATLTNVACDEVA